MTKPVLAVRGLGVRLSRNGVESAVLDGVDIEIGPGEIVALVGESGSGKSTIGRAVQGLLPRDSFPVVTGSIRVADVEIVGASERQLRDARRSLVRAVPQDPMAALNPTMTIRTQLLESAPDAPVLDWMRRTGLSDVERMAGEYPHQLSGGQRQRLLIAMAMMARPKVLVADEITTALDATTQSLILKLLSELVRDTGTAVLLITHDLAVASRLANRIIVLKSARVVETGTTRQVLARPAHAHTIDLLASRFDLTSDRTRPLPTAGSKAAEPAAPWPQASKPADAPALELSDVSKSFVTGKQFFWKKGRDRAVLNAINLSIASGECVALVGESGAGKSTILRIAAGLTAPDRGTVSRGGSVPPQVVFQDPASALTPWLSVGEQIGERMHGADLEKRRARVVEAMGLVGLSPGLADALPAELSIGQCQRAVLARAIVVPPNLLLCDEPTSAMDVSLAAATLNLLGGLRRRLGMAMLFVTHDLAAARIIAERIVVLHDGVLIEDAEPDHLISKPRMPHTRALVAAAPRLHADVTQ